MAQGPGDTTGEVLSIPGFVPGPGASFEISDDLLGDAGVDIGFRCHVILHCLVPRAGRGRKWRARLAARAWSTRERQRMERADHCAGGGVRQTRDPLARTGMR